MLSNLYVALVLSSASTMLTSAVEECLGCHTEARVEPPARFHSGFGRWKDNQCYGCHAEIHEVGDNLVTKQPDPRYLTLPVSDERLRNLAKHPMPYLKAPLHLGSGSGAKYHAQSLVNFLRRPSASCSEGECRAISMMAYPAISLADIKALSIEVSSESISQDQRVVKKGELLYEQACAACHGLKGGVAQASMSLYAKEYLLQYQHSGKSHVSYRLSQNQAAALQAYFTHSRNKLEEQVDSKLTAIEQQWLQIPNSPLNRSERQYVWKGIWRDGGCVHCHGIKGRAKQRFDTSSIGLTEYLKKGNGKSLYYRLKIRQAEQDVGIGASVPGMPMTGAALHPKIIELVGRWIKSGCNNQQGKRLC